MKERYDYEGQRIISIHTKKSLCYRCEYRARFLEEGLRPRLECGMIDQSNHSCYMFQPVRPVLVEANKGEERPISFSYWSGRFHIVEQEPELELVITNENEFILPIWVKNDTNTD